MDECNGIVRGRIDALLTEMMKLVLQDQSASLREVECGLWRLLLALGAVLIGAFLLHQALRPRPTGYVHAGQHWVLGKSIRTQIGTKFGKVWFGRAIGRPRDNPRGARDLPVDRELGLVKSFSLGVVSMTARLCAQLAFGSVRDLFADIHGWAPSTRSVLRMVDAVGGQASSFVEQAPAPEGDGAVIVIEVDCKGAPMITSRELNRRRQHRKSKKGNQRHARKERRRQHTRVRRAPGKKSKNAKMSAVAVIYSLKSKQGGLEGPINKRVYGTFRSLEQLFIGLRREVDKRDGRHKQILFLADAEQRIWTLQQRYFPEAKVAVDWWHIVEKLWEAGTLVHGEDKKIEREQLVASLSQGLRRGQVDRVIAELRHCLDGLPRRGPGSAWRRKRLRQIVEHLEKWQSHLRYHALRKQDLPISTGAGEGAVRNLVTMRLDGPGMRWSPQRADMILQLRCILNNGQWAEFEEFLARTQLTLAAQPTRTQPHDAVEKARIAA